MERYVRCEAEEWLLKDTKRCREVYNSGAGEDVEHLLVTGI